MAPKNSRSTIDPVSQSAKSSPAPVRAEKVDAMAVAPSSTAAVSTAKPATAEVKTAATPATATVAAATKAASVPAAAAVGDKPRDRSSVLALIARLQDPDAEVARDAAASLGRLPADAEAVQSLCAVLRNANHYFHPVVRAAAASALGLLGDRSAVDALIHATGDTMAEASEEAIKSLGMLGDRRALPSLAAVIRNERDFFIEPVRRAAQEAQRRIESTPAKS